MRGVEMSRRDALAVLAGAVHPAAGGGDPTAGWTERRFSARGYERAVWSKGTGAPVALLHEIAGPTVEHFHLGDCLVRAGFEVHSPVFFGRAGQATRFVHTARFFASKCVVTSDFSCKSATAPSAIHDWVVALCTSLGQGGRRVGVVGMCMTGIMPLAALRARVVVAPVLCQPSLPMGPANVHALGLPPSDVELVRWRMANEGLTALLVRYRADRISPPERTAALRRTFGPALEVFELDGEGHSSLVHSASPVAIGRVVDFLGRRLGTARAL